MKRYIHIGLIMIIAIAILSGCTNKEDKALEIDYKIATTQEIVDAMDKQDWVIIDTRISDAFNGWKIDGVSRGGRIKGAKNFSANWIGLDDVDEDKLIKILDDKGIDKNKHLILYDTDGKDVKIVGDFLTRHGYENLYTYDVNKWADDETLPMESYVNYYKIIPATILKDVLDKKYPETFSKDKDIKVVEASWGDERTSYSKGHIPTAYHINTDIIEPPTETAPIMWRLADAEKLKKFALEYGFKNDDIIIVTSDEPLASYRMATVLRYMGVEDVRVLNGGTAQWVRAGYKLETSSNKPKEVSNFGGDIPMNPRIIDTMEEVKIGLGEEDYVLVDNRTWKEYIGKDSGYSYHKKKGRIPGSVYGYAGIENSYSMDYYRNPDNTMINGDVFINRWKDQGIDLNKHLTFMCGSGWRAAEVFYYADVVGLEDISIYSDGWIGWSNDKSNKIEVGD